MKNTIKLNHTNKTIEITKAFERATCIYGSPEYLMLKSAREDYPEYSVVAKTATKKSIFASLTVEQIENYLTKKNIKICRQEKKLKMRILLQVVLWRCVTQACLLICLMIQAKSKFSVIKKIYRKKKLKCSNF